MARATPQARLSYRREKLRQSFSARTAALLIMANVIAVILLGALAVFLFERGANPQIQNYGSALWLTIVSIATVGYGDSYPITVGGRISMVVILASGIALISVYVSTRSAIRVRDLQRRSKGLDTNVKIRGHYLVCGWNQRGRFTLDRLRLELEPEKTPIVLLCDLEDCPYDEEYIFSVRGSATQQSDLQRANIEQAKAAVLLADDTKGGSSSDIDARTVLAALTIRSLNREIQMTAEALIPENIHHLELAGVGEILDSNLLSGYLMAQSARHYGLINLLTEIVTGAVGAVTSRVPVSEEMAGMTGDELEFYILKEYAARVLAVVSEGNIESYETGAKLKPGDVLVITTDVTPPGQSS